MKRNKIRRHWKGWIRWSEAYRTNGGRGMVLVDMLKAVGVIAERGTSPYVGHVGINIRLRNKKDTVKAARVIECPVETLCPTPYYGYSHK